jgi:hypothetical protein
LLDTENSPEKSNLGSVERNGMETHSKPRKLLLRLVSTGLGLLVLFALMEIVFRFMPLRESAGMLTVDDRNYVPRFEPNREHTFSRNWNFSMVTQKKTNQAGFFSNFEYQAQGKLPLVAVIGDSYVEALQVPNADSFPGILGTRGEGKSRVYAYGASGSPLSTYLKYAQWVGEGYDAKHFIFSIVANDFDESFLEYRSRSRRASLTFFPESIESPGLADLVTVPYYPEKTKRSFLTKTFRQSAVARYLLYNCEVDPRRIAFNIQPNVQTQSKPDSDRLDLGYRSIDHFIRLLPEATGVPPRNILLVLDAERHLIYDSDSDKSHPSFYALMKEKLIETAANAQIDWINLSEAFGTHYKANHMKFEFPTDGHWNKLGHSIVADAIMKTEFWKQINAESN